MDTRRLHISGLTPAITQHDLALRLSSFGTVKAIDGFGLLDGVGRPRKFAYATLEATPANLAKCMNILSGSTWKGAKLRIGEAKPDFADRISAENRQSQELAAKRAQRRLRHRLYMARHASDMSLVTPESAAHKGAWVVTPLGRVHRPMRMRPLRPLPPPTTTSTTVVSRKGRFTKERKKVKKYDLRARRRKIDMTRWGSVHLTGRFLDPDISTDVRPAITVDTGDGNGDDDDSEDEERDEEEESPEHTAQNDNTQDKDIHAKPHMPTLHPSPVQPSQPSPIRPPSSSTTLPTNTSTGSDADANPGLALETKHSLDILASLFGTTGTIDDADDWVGGESLGSDIDEADIMHSRQTRALVDNDEDGGQFEVVPREGGQQALAGGDVNEDVDMEGDDTHASVASPTNIEASPANNPSQAPVRPTNLKDLFAPREEEGGFSLVNHLNLDLELDEDVPFSTTHDETQLEYTAPTPDPASIVTHTTTTTTQLPKHEYASRIQLDPSQPLFFPLTLLSSHPHAKNIDISTNAKSRPKDPFDVLKARGLDWRSSGFYRTLTEDEVRGRWDARKGELTREWKKRCREAGRAGRGRKGRGEVDDVD